MVEVEVLQVATLADGSGHLLLLKSANDERVLPIQVGPFEAVSIAMGVAGVTATRPMPYELLSSVIMRLGGSLKQVVVHDLRDDAFIGQIEIATALGIIEVDCRSSDAVALAVRAKCPIFVTEDVMRQAGTRIAAGGVDEEEDDQRGLPPAPR